MQTNIMQTNTKIVYPNIFMHEEMVDDVHAPARNHIYMPPS